MLEAIEVASHLWTFPFDKLSRRRRPLASIAQGFVGLCLRLDALTHRVSDEEQVIARGEKKEVGPERRTALVTAARVSRDSEQDVELNDRISEHDGRAVLQTFERGATPEQQESRSMHQAAEDFKRSQVGAPDLMEAMRPFIVMVFEEIAEALVKVIATQDLGITLLAAASQSRSYGHLE